MSAQGTRPWVTVACGGTGGHLFPGIAVGEVLGAHGCAVTLMVSTKDVDRRGVSLAPEFESIALPAVGLEKGRSLDFFRSGWKSYVQASRAFRSRRPSAVLAMGGFTSAAPILAGRRAGAATFLHEANSIPGRANRWLARWVDRAFVGFPQTAARLRNCRITVTGTPVRSRFGGVDPRSCRLALGLQPEDPVLLVMGGSQGASAINDLVVAALPGLRKQSTRLQFIHLTGTRDFERVAQAHAAWPGKAVVRDFAGEMEVLLGAATVAVTRAGASTLAELAASGLVSVLVPYPHASDNHQHFNARALADTGAALMLEEASASPGALISAVHGLIGDDSARRNMQEALRRWHRAEAAEQIASEIMSSIGLSLLRDIEGARRVGNVEPRVASSELVSPSGKTRDELQETLHG